MWPAAGGGAVATLPPGALGGGGAGAAAAAGDIIASMTFSDTPFFLSAISASVLVSKLVGLVRIFAMTTRSESPALSMSMTDWLVSVSWAEAAVDAAIRNAATSATTTKSDLMTRLQEQREFRLA